jgi:hypothetical protein
MDVTQILHDLATAERLPVEAIEAARANRAAMVPAFVRMVDQFAAGSDVEDVGALFVVFHLLGEWRERSAYRPLAALLRLPTYEIDDILGDAIPETSHRVMAAVFDGDPAPLYEIIRDPEADEIVRSRMCEALAMVTLRGGLPREQTAQFLRSCFSELEPQDQCFLWEGWENAIAMLGLVELAPVVKQACERGFIDPQAMSYADFERDLQRAVKGGPPPGWHTKREFELFDDTVEVLSTWAYSDPESNPEEDLAEEEDEWEPRERVPEERMLWRPDEGPAVNPYKDVGRNDPCPCGSGKKFKKCCLGKTAPQPPAAASGSRKLSDVVTSLRAALPQDDADIPIEGDYDPLVAPDPDEWLSLEEDERIAMVSVFHRRARIRVPNARVHAVIHTVVENQIAEGDALPVRGTLERLMGEGLDRHDAIHAIGMVLMGHMNDLMKAGHAEGDPNLPYYAELERLTAEAWRRSG